MTHNRAVVGGATKNVCFLQNKYILVLVVLFYQARM